MLLTCGVNSVDFTGLGETEVDVLASLRSSVDGVVGVGSTDGPSACCRRRKVCGGAVARGDLDLQGWTRCHFCLGVFACLARMEVLVVNWDLDPGNGLLDFLFPRLPLGVGDDDRDQVPQRIRFLSIPRSLFKCTDDNTHF